MENREESECHPTRRREFLRGAGLAACRTALRLAAPTRRVMAGSADDGRGASRGLDGSEVLKQEAARDTTEEAAGGPRGRVDHPCAGSLLEAQRAAGDGEPLDEAFIPGDRVAALLADLKAGKPLPGFPTPAAKPLAPARGARPE